MLQLPRFLRAFLIISAIIGIPSLYIVYRSSDSIDPDSDLLSRTEVHWDAGGLAPKSGETYQQKDMEWEDDGLVQAMPLTHTIGRLADDVVKGGVIMKKLGNETAKAELGRATWKLLHLTTLRFPDEPTKDERDALKAYFHLSSRLYPCGECAEEFQKLLAAYPPQTSSRKSASLWLCSVHNMVNERLGKPEFDCLTLDATYDCGCGDASGTPTSTAGPLRTGKVNEIEDQEDDWALRMRKPSFNLVEVPSDNLEGADMDDVPDP